MYHPYDYPRYIDTSRNELTEPRTEQAMTTLPRFARTPLLLATSLLAFSSVHGYAAGRDGHDYVTDSQRASPRTGLLKQCIRTGLPDAGAQVEDCTGHEPSAKAAQPSPPPVPAAPPPAPAPVAEKATPEPVPHYEEEKTPAPDDGIVGSSVNPNYEIELAAAESAMAPKPPTTSVARVTLNVETSFDLGQAVLRPAARTELDRFAAELRPLDYSAVRVVGHADRTGNRQANQQLSLRRAQAVKDYLIGQRIDPERIQAEGLGSDQPVTGPQDCQGLKKQALIDCLQPDRRVAIEARADKMVRQ
jgi:outer membrane protein OmpA-like peptidoglycan-associated protein